MRKKHTYTKKNEKRVATVGDYTAKRITVEKIAKKNSKVDEENVEVIFTPPVKITAN